MSAEPTHLEPMSPLECAFGLDANKWSSGLTDRRASRALAHHGFDQFSSQKIIAASMESRYWYQNISTILVQCNIYCFV